LEIAQTGQISRVYGSFLDAIMKINPSPCFSIDLAIASTLDRQAVENLISEAEGVADVVKKATRDEVLAREKIKDESLYKIR